MVSSVIRVSVPREARYLKDKKGAVLGPSPRPPLHRKKLEGFESHIFAVRTARLAVRTARLAVQPRSSRGPDRNAAANLPAVRSVRSVEKEMMEITGQVNPPGRRTRCRANKPERGEELFGRVA